MGPGGVNWPPIVCASHARHVLRTDWLISSYPLVSEVSRDDAGISAAVVVKLGLVDECLFDSPVIIASGRVHQSAD